MKPYFKPFLNQNYDQLKAECLEEKKLFKDPKFPATNSSMYRLKKPKIDGVPVKFKWKRPHEILKDSEPTFIGTNINPDDIFQGELGDWLGMHTFSFLKINLKLFSIIFKLVLVSCLSSCFCA